VNRGHRAYRVCVWRALDRLRSVVVHGEFCFAVSPYVVNGRNRSWATKSKRKSHQAVYQPWPGCKEVMLSDTAAGDWSRWLGRHFGCTCGHLCAQ
jgi:hypothetical protein